MTVTVAVGSVSFVVHGIPAPQGSKTPWGTEANANTRPWRAAVAAEAAAAMEGMPPFSGPLELVVVFTFPRPKSHYRHGSQSHLVKHTAPIIPATKPDLDKLLRAVGDSLTGIVCRDDAQIASIRATKLYGSPSAAITVRQYDPVLIYP